MVWWSWLHKNVTLGQISEKARSTCAVRQTAQSTPREVWDISIFEQKTVLGDICRFWCVVGVYLKEYMLECIWIRFWLCCSVIWQFIMYTHFVIIFDDVICWIWMLIWRPVSRSWGDSPSLDPNIGISTLSELSFTVKGIPPFQIQIYSSTAVRG